MRAPIRIAPLLLVVACAPALVAQPPAPAPTAAHRALAERVLTTTPLIDGHNDLPWAIRNAVGGPRNVDAYDLRQRTPGHTDLARLAAGRIGGQFWSVYIPGEIRDSGYARVQLEQIDIAKRIIARYPDKLEFVTTADGVRRAFAAGRIGSLLGMEGGHAIENSLGALRAFHDLGVRYMTLTHNVHLDWADAAAPAPRLGGLSRFGREVVREMNRLGMLVDLSHVSPGVMSDVLGMAEAPVIFSHSNARAVTDVPRNVPDSILTRVRTNGGVVMATFVPGFSSRRIADHGVRRAGATVEIRNRFAGDTAAIRRELAAWATRNPAPRATLADVADHLDHLKRVAGAEHVGIGGDFDGIDSVVEGLEDVSTYPAIFAELARRGWTERELRGLAGENVLRVMAQAEAVAARLQQERPASNATLEQLDQPTTRAPGTPK